MLSIRALFRPNFYVLSRSRCSEPSTSCNLVANYRYLGLFSVPKCFAIPPAELGKSSSSRFGEPGCRFGTQLCFGSYWTYFVWPRAGKFSHGSTLLWSGWLLFFDLHVGFFVVLKEFLFSTLQEQWCLWNVLLIMTRFRTSTRISPGLQIPPLGWLLAEVSAVSWHQIILTYRFNKSLEVNWFGQKQRFQSKKCLVWFIKLLALFIWFPTSGLCTSCFEPYHTTSAAWKPK